MNFKFPVLRILKKLQLETLPGFTTKYYYNSIFGFSYNYSIKSYYSKVIKKSILYLNEKRKLKYLFGLKNYKLKNLTKLLYSKTIFKEIDFNYILNNKLDIILVKLGYFNTIKESRLYIKHGHILINGYKITVYNFNIKSFDKINIVNLNFNLHTQLYNIKNLTSFNYNKYFNIFSISNINTLNSIILRNLNIREYITFIDLKTVLKHV